MIQKWEYIDTCKSFIVTTGYISTKYKFIQLTCFDYTYLSILPYYEETNNSNMYPWIIISVSKFSKCLAELTAGTTLFQSILKIWQTKMSVHKM